MNFLLCELLASPDPSAKWVKLHFANSVRKDKEGEAEESCLPLCNNSCFYAPPKFNQDYILLLLSGDIGIISAMIQLKSLNSEVAP